jgi:predicted permease
MTYFPSLLSIIITLFLLMVAGFYCRKRDIIDTVASKRLSKLIICVGQPMLIIGALSGAEFNAENLTLAWQATLVGFAAHLFMAVASYLICKSMKQTDETKIFEFTLIFSNCGFIGFPILDSILGDGKGSFMGAFYIISFHLLMWTWGIIILARRRDDIKMTPKKALINYGTIPVALGLLLYFSKPLFSMLGGLEGTGALTAAFNFIDGFVGQTFSYLGGLCTPISTLITGSLIGTLSLSKMFTNARLYLHAFIKLIAFPIAACLIAKLCGLSDTLILVATAMVGMPSATSATMLAEIHDITPGYASQTVGLTSLLSTATLPLVIFFAQWVIGL